LPEIEKFLYRGQRLQLDLPTVFETEEQAFHGHTVDLSDSGALVRLNGIIAPETVGTLRIQMGAGDYEVKARVIHSELFDVGLGFCFTSDLERRFLTTLVSALSKKLHRS
jgi:hypothetical protein